MQLKSPSRTICFCGGGTGGHIFPGLAVAEALKHHAPHYRIVFIGSNRGIEARVVPAAGFELITFDMQGMYGVYNLKRQIQAIYKNVQVVRQLMRFYQDHSPHLLIGLGGFAAGLPLLVGGLHGIPFVLLEQNVIAGLSNRFLAPWAKHIFSGMPTRNLPQQRLTVVGNPTRKAFFATSSACSAYPPKSTPTLLVLGGSQGAYFLNKLILEMLGNHPLLPWHIVHQTGAADFQRVANYANQQSIHQNYQAVPFIDDMVSALTSAHLILCRSGAMTLAEIAMIGRPALLVPLPTAAQNHQHHNAQTWVEAGAARLLPQSELTPQRLWQLLVELSQNVDVLDKMAFASAQLAKPSAATDIITKLREMEFV
jgi:UDP-N-acetylglucosamine--N-acetylmuramyl-(pentapeptide) pyrophosphoryl-undecaprenol N-acetylglucosamine transferase